MPIRWDKKANRYRDAKGRFIGKDKIRFEIDKLVQVSAQRIERLTIQLTRGKINIATWQIAMRSELKTAYTVSASVAKGGWKQMSFSDWGKVGANTKKQYAYLNRFANQLDKLSDKQIIARAKLYASSVRTTYHQSELELAEESEQLVKRVLNAKESCSECISWASRGFIEAETMAKIGSLLCRTNCRCSLEFR